MPSETPDSTPKAGHPGGSKNDADESGAVFPYPGSKSLLAGWIVSHFADHELYVEGFGGSAAVLTSKDKSSNEVFNDIDGDITHFFTTLRDHTEELIKWLENTPMSRELHKKYGSEFYRGLRPVDDIERAGRFFYLRNTQFAQKYTGLSGFRGSSEKNQSSEYQNRVDALWSIRDRLQHVQIEQLDYKELIERYDRPNALFYFDPPYIDAGRALYTGHDEFDHQEFVNILDSIQGYWVTSYRKLPEGLREGYYVVDKDVRGTMRLGVDEWEQDNTERLVMNYHPETTAMFSKPNQSRLTEATQK